MLTLGAAPASAAPRHVPGQLIVTFEEGTKAEARAAAHRRAGGQVADRIERINADVVRVGAGNEDSSLARYRAEDRVRVAELDVVVTALHDDLSVSPTNDPYLAREWGLQNDALTVQPPDTSPRHDADIDAPGAWGQATGTGTKIAILDTGIDLNHEEFPRPNKVVVDKNFSASRTAEDKYGHGTHVAGTAGAPANNAKGVAGVAYDAKLLNVKVLGDNGSGSCSSIANGIIWSADQAADVINMSLGGGACSAEESAVNYAWSKGVVLAAAAGNSNSSNPSCPACYENTLAVAATDNGDYKASFSNYGSWVDVAAPGVKVFSTFPNHRNRIGKTNYDYGSGTSMATPHVAGAAALIQQQLGAAKTNTEVRSRIENFGDHISETDAYWSAKRLNACNAVSGQSATCSLSRE